MEKDHRGITLVELIIAVAVASIVLGTATFFLYTARQNYNRASATIQMQSQTQILMEQIGTWIMEGNDVESSGGMLVIYQIQRTVTANLPAGVTVSTEASKRVLWQSADGKLYTKTFDGIADADSDTTGDMSGYETTENCIGEYVSAASFVIEEQKNVTVTLSMEFSGLTYTAKDTFQVRNRLAK